MSEPGTHSMRPIYERDGTVIGYMCERCGHGTWFHDEAQKLHGNPCYPVQPIPFQSVALGILSTATLVFALTFLLGVQL